MIKKGLTYLIKILGFILFVLVLIYLFRCCKNFGYHIFSDQAKDAASSSEVVEAVISVSEDESLLKIGEELQRLSIIDDKYVFAISVRFMDGYDKIQPGDYSVNSSMKPSEILEKMTTENAEGSTE